MTNKIFPIAKRTIEMTKLLKGQIGLLELNSHYQIMRKDANALINFLLFFILKSVVFFILYLLHSSSSSLFISFHSLPQPHHHRHRQNRPPSSLSLAFFPCPSLPFVFFDSDKLRGVHGDKVYRERCRGVIWIVGKLHSFYFPFVLLLRSFSLPHCSFLTSFLKVWCAISILFIPLNFENIFSS